MIRDEEKFAADIFERFAPELLQRDLGPSTRRNGEDESGILVDWTYEDTKPPVALEVTAIHLPGERQVVGEIQKNLQPELDRMVGNEDLGNWLVEVDVGAHVRRLLPEVASLIRRGESLRVGDYSSDDLMKAGCAGSGGLHRRLESLGLRELILRGAGPPSVECLVSGGGQEIAPFDDRLVSAVNDNRAKLVALPKYDTHLAVVVFDFQASTVPERTTPPDLQGVDGLWIIHSWQGPSGRAEMWHALAGQRSWVRRAWS